MAAKTASLSVNIIADAAKARAGLKEAETAFGKFRREVGEAQGAMGKFKTIGGAALDSVKANALAFAGAAGAALAAFAVKSVKAASNLNESINAVNVTFGKSSKGILEFSERSADAVGMSSRAFNEFAVQFAGFGEKIADGGGDIAKITTDITKRVADFASVMNLDMAEAAQIFQSSLAGQTEPIRRFGIDMSAAAVETYALATGLVKSKSEMTEAVKIQARYGLLMEKTNKFAGDFTNTQDSMANSTRTLQARVEDLQAKLGEKLLPAFEELLTFANDAIVVFEKFGSALSKIPGNETVGGFEGIRRAVEGVTSLFENGGVQITEDMANAMREGNDVMSRGRLEAMALAGSFDDLNARFDRGAKLISGLTEEWQTFLNGLDKRDAFDDAEQAVKEYEQTFKKAMAGNKQAMDSLEASGRNAARSIASAMEAADLIPPDQSKRILFLLNTNRLDEALRLLKLVDSWYVTVAQRALVTPSGMGSGRPPAPIAGPPPRAAAPAAKAPSPIQQIKTISTTRLPHLAGGGTVTAGGMALVGEEGPELVNLPRGASVIPSIPSRKMMGGGMTVNITVQAGLVSSPDQVGQQIIDAIRRAERRSGQVFVNA